MVQSHAAVYCGDQHRSNHGTTIQITQPNPSIEIHLNGASSHGKRSLEWSPNSPHKLGGNGPKKPRTLKPRNLSQ